MRLNIQIILAFNVLAKCGATSNENASHVRRNQGESECRVYEKITEFGEEPSTNDYVCSPIDSPNELLAINGLSEEFMASNTIESGITVFRYSSVITSSLSEGITLSDDQVTVIQDPQYTASNVGEKSTLVIRIIAPDESTSSSESELSDSVFGTSDDPFNLRSGYSDCSYDTLIFNGFQGTSSSGVNIENGVTTINIGISVNGKDNSEIRSEVVSVANTQLGDLSSQFDYVMLCIPPGTSGGWIAYAYINHWLSVYNNNWCTYPSGQMHELGHNLGLAHSGETSSYDDQSGMMGYSYGDDDGPRMCFNAAKGAQLGWYDDKLKLIDVSAPSFWIGKIVGISDYADAAADEIVIIRITEGTSFDYYVSFNRASGINSGTKEGGNQVLVHRRSKGFGYGESDLLKKLDASNSNFYEIEEDEIEITVEEIDISSVRGYATVKVVVQDAAPVPAPVAPPIPAPVVPPVPAPVAPPVPAPVAPPVPAPVAPPVPAPTGSAAVFIKNISFKSRVRNNGKVVSRVYFSIRTTEGDKVEGAEIKLAFPWNSSDEKQKACTTKSNGKCTIKLPAYDPTEVPTIDVGLSDLVTSVGPYEEELNKKYDGECPVFSSGCEFVTIDNTAA